MTANARAKIRRGVAQSGASRFRLRSLGDLDLFRTSTFWFRISD